MAVYRLSITGQIPLKMQLGSVPANTVVKLREFSQVSESSTVGTTTLSNPTICRPSTVGLGTNVFTTSLDNTSTSRVPIITSFSAAPTLPSVTIYNNTNLPFRKRYAFPRGSEIIIYPANAIVLYSSTPIATTGELCWEEK